jgi:uncharacterized protein YkwD
MICQFPASKPVLVRRPPVLQNERTVRFLRRTLLVIGSCLALARGASAEGQKPVKRAGETKLLDYAGAQKLMLELINRDRAKAGLSPVVLDEAASKAGLRHARDMTAKGFTGHIGTDGSVPEQRYTESGGVHFVQENAACLFDGKERKLDATPRFDPAKLAALQKMFMDEVPPNDGHRRNVLKPEHNRVGIGLAQPEGVNQPCLAQEFVDSYGSYEALPKEAKPKAKLRIAGTISKPLVFGGIGVGRTPLPTPKRLEGVSGARGYAIPAPDQLYFGPGFKTPKPVETDGKRFSIELELGSQRGQYAVSIWARRGTGKLFMVSMRTIAVR